jgi:tetratricopeptide (TPR) repeat protein
VHTLKRAGFMAVRWPTALATLIVIQAVGQAAAQTEPADAWRTLDPVVRATNRGVALMERYEYAAAVEALERACKLAPRSAEARVNLAIALYNRCGKGDLERAEVVLDKVLIDDPNNVRALYFRGIMHQYSGRDEQAITCFERVLKFAPHDAYAWYLLARSKSHLGRPCRAELERAIQENSALASAYYDLMRIAAQAGDQDQAQRCQKRFVTLRQSPLCELVVMPQYRRMGSLATVQPISGVAYRGPAGGELRAEPARTIAEAPAAAPLRGVDIGERSTVAETIAAGHGVQMAVADVNSDGRLDMVTTGAVRNAGRGILLFLSQPDGSFTQASEAAGLASIHGASACAFGDYDNDDRVDLFVSCAGPNHLLRGGGDGTFADVTATTETGGADVISASAVFLDADHDGDLDIYVCNVVSAGDLSPAPNQLLNNNANGTFTDIAGEAGVACQSERSLMLAPADLDRDRDTDLVVFNHGAPARAFLNDRGGKYHEAPLANEPIRGEYGGVCQDFNADGHPDLLAFRGPVGSSQLYLNDGTGAFKASSQFDGCIEALATWDRLTAARVVDVDLDGDLDVTVFGQDGHALLNDGHGRFVSKPRLWPRPPDHTAIGTELSDLTGDGIPDLIRACDRETGTIELLPTQLTPPANWLALVPTGDRGADKRTRSPASGFGTRLELRCGLHSQVVTYTGLSGSLSQSQRPLIFGLNGAAKADYLAFVWPDGVTQCENELAARTCHRISETERRVSSCPVLFAWSGQRFAFVSDFAGVGGIGYFVAPGQYAPPQACEFVKIEPEQLALRDGRYELRLCEPMEEVAYIDRVELLAVDHPAGSCVFPDERLAVTGPAPTHRLLCPADRVFAVRASGPDGADCVEQLAQVDRVYAYQPEIDKRFVGFCRLHTLVLEFPRRPAAPESGQSVYLFLNGWIEYPYSQSTYAAAQADVTWQPMRIDRQADDGQWETIVPDAGAPGGLGRTIAIDLTDTLPAGDCMLRISTNLEIYYDQVFLAADQGTDELSVTAAPLAQATLRRLGFPLEYSPDGRHPTIYTYDIIEPSSAFKLPKGAYTRYGPVEGLLAEYDDRYVIMGTGDELAVSFDAFALPSLAEGQVRSFVLVSHAYCKDMDLYTAEPDTVTPLPFRGMSAYPYPAAENYPDQARLRRYQRRFNTRVAD